MYYVGVPTSPVRHWNVLAPRYLVDPYPTATRSQRGYLAVVHRARDHHRVVIVQSAAASEWRIACTHTGISRYSGVSPNGSWP
jgi:hypothetical protein